MAGRRVNPDLSCALNAILTQVPQKSRTPNVLAHQLTAHKYTSTVDHGPQPLSIPVALSSLILRQTLGARRPTNADAQYRWNVDARGR